MATEELYPSEGIDEIHPRTEFEFVLFGRGRERMVFESDVVTLKVKRGEPRVERGLMTIDTEMIELQMAGESELLGPIRLRGGTQLLEDAERPITGKVIELEPKTRFPAENFFDVFVEVETRLGTVYNRKPEHMVATITDLPPDFAKTPYRSTTEINLYLQGADEDAPPVGAIIEVQHDAA
jgi:hypothetical protein